ncbi:BaiN/RdsA family NAD(P)/FAD-dependent oxidoreductase [Alkaliphilus peptidifermentans]|uniref:Aminoacetone oxidase family FAD-binding enzyme n=1 Tax=Alkaliphilus peptidifermentans DSM 18978 TaxID=1120976 RepID=A0A1G5KL71_9FIRM|nr:NAD(P)/FAD-dependent oxidoreductase [Alkaliphilus peptidifermentans]SCZ01355.1 hypothetical protein SAMN03080606_03580 [Alkaliphilus peptidifermentans DSM 18978]
MERSKVIIVGGGAAGMMAAITAAGNNKQVVLLEKQQCLGSKLRITGGGRCNITNIATPDKMMENVIRNKKFLFPSFHSMTSQDLMRILKSKGIPLKVEEEGKVFPESNKSEDIIDYFIEELNRLNVKVYLNNEVKNLIIEDNHLKGVVLANGKELTGDSVIIATGGQSYPYTGSTGDGYRLAKSIGHHIIPIRASLVPIIIEEKWIQDLMGISFDSVNIYLKEKKSNKQITSGGLIFTHFGISGPAVLRMSAHIAGYNNKEIPKLKIDFLPDLTEDSLHNILKEGIQNNRNKSLKATLSQYLPKNFIVYLLKHLEIDIEVELNHLQKQQRHRIVQLIKGLELTIKGLGGLKEAIITAGGISVKEINPNTMESKLLKGLFFCGEIIDVDALTGGFNLHIAFSTGYLAGQNV